MSLYYLGVIAILLFVIAILYFLLQSKRSKSRLSIKCPPEIIRPLPLPVGICGIRGCKIQQWHSHAEALCKRLQEDKK